MIDDKWECDNDLNVRDMNGEFELWNKKLMWILQGSSMSPVMVK